MERWKDLSRGSILSLLGIKRVYGVKDDLYGSTSSQTNYYQITNMSKRQQFSVKFSELPDGEYEL